MENLLILFENQQAEFFALKIFLILVSVFYIIFSVIVAHRVKALNVTITVPLSSMFTVLADVQILLAVFLFFYSLFIL